MPMMRDNVRAPRQRWKLGRWKTPSMFHRYDIIDEQDLNNSVAKLAAALATVQG